MTTFTCACGDTLNVPENYTGTKAYCLRCGKSVDIPEALRAPSLEERSKAETVRKPAADPSETVAADASDTGEQPPHYELVRNADGKENWKITCFCGKRLLTPAKSEISHGRCPKCGRRLRLPGHESLKETVDLPPGAVDPKAGESSSRSIIEERIEERKRSGEFSKSEFDKELAQIMAGQDDVATDVALLIPEVPKVDAVLTASAAADRLRPQRESKPDPSGSASGLLAAWPLAGFVRRGLAGFIDVTFAMMITATIFMLSLNGILPEIFKNVFVELLVLLVAGVLNDGLFHILAGGSLGKLLVVVAVRNFRGTPMEPWRALLRAFCKWLLLPMSVLALIDPAQRTLHDLLCGTLVLKGRARKRVEAQKPVA
jgi:uncharacterized RDD family membrane protein YckC